MFSCSGLMKITCAFLLMISWMGVASAQAVDGAARIESADTVFTSPLDNRFTFYAGIQNYSAKGEFSSTRTGRPQYELDLDALDLDENADSTIVVMNFALGERWNLRFDYFGFHDSAAKIAEFDFEFDDVIIPIGARVESSIDLDVYVLSLSYNFIHTERARFGVGGGIHAVDIDLSILGSLTAGGIELSLGEGEEDFLAPIPNLYLSGAYALTNKCIARFGAGWLSVDYDDYSGQLLTANATLEYWPFKNSGFGLGYRYLGVDVDYETSRKKETYDVDLPGPMFYITLGF